jgi:transcriptional antiterminator Rof (Rho-off)
VIQKQLLPLSYEEVIGGQYFRRNIACRLKLLLHLEMVKGERAASKSATNNLQSPIHSTELQLVKLLQDESEWEVNPLRCVTKLLELLDEIEIGDGFDSARRGPAENSPLRDEEALLLDLQKWLDNQSSSSTNEERGRDWQLSSKNPAGDTSANDAKGNRYSTLPLCAAILRQLIALKPLRFLTIHGNLLRL